MVMVFQMLKTNVLKKLVQKLTTDVLGRIQMVMEFSIKMMSVQKLQVLHLTKDVQK